MESHGLPDHLITNIRLAINVKAWLLKHGVDDMLKQVDDIANHGCYGGVPGFIYTYDIADFLKQEGVLLTIRGMIEDRAEGVGETMFGIALLIMRASRQLGKFECERCAAMALVSPIDDIVKDEYMMSRLVWWAVEQAAYEMADVKIDIDSATDEGSANE